MKDLTVINTQSDDEKLDRIINVLLNIGKKKIKKGINEESFKDLMEGMIEVFNYYKIDKIYNSTIIPTLNDNIASRIGQLLGIITSPNSPSLKFEGQGGTCFDWAILMMDVISSLDGKGVIESDIIQFEGSIHTMVLVSYGLDYYLIDPFGKGGEYMCQLSVGKNVYLGERDGIQEYAMIECLSPLSFSYMGEIIKYTKFDGVQLSDSISIDTFDGMIRIKDFYENSVIDLDIDLHMDGSNSYTVEFDEIVTYGDIGVLKDLLKNTKTSYDFLLGVIDYTSPELTSYGQKKLKHIANKIDFDYLQEFFFGDFN